MAVFRVLKGTHSEGGKTYRSRHHQQYARSSNPGAGDIVESKADLVALDPQKFELLSSEDPVEEVTEEETSEE